MNRSSSQAPSVLLCSEAGAGRGHVVTLATVARALGAGQPCQAILPSLTHAAELEPFCDLVERGKRVRRMPNPPAERALNWASWLLARGFADPETLLSRFDWWCDALHAIRPALVVENFAPTALLAARALGIPTVVTGATFYSPPSTLEQYPDLVSSEDAATHGIDLGDAPPPDEAAMCDIINRTLGPRGLPLLTRLPEVYAADLALPRGVALWDPYAKWRERPLLLPVERLPPLSEGQGKEVFIYFSTSELREPAIREALLRLPFAARLVAPGLSPALARRLAANPRLRIEPAPLPPSEIVARSRVILCAGQAGTLSLAALAGIPVLALPVQLEKLSNALGASGGLSACRVVPRTQRSAQAILDALADLWFRPGLTQTASQEAKHLRAQYGESATESYRRLLVPLLRDAGGSS